MNNEFIRVTRTVKIGSRTDRSRTTDRRPPGAAETDGAGIEESSSLKKELSYF